MDTTLSNIENNPHLLDIMLGVEDVLDSMDLYVYNHWIDGEVVEGPIIKNYWINIALKFKYEQMPDPKGAKRLMKSDIRVKYDKIKQEIPNRDASSRLYNPSSANHEEGETETVDVWIVKLEVPRRLIGGLVSTSTDFYQDDVDVDDIESAIDSGITEESGIVED